MQSEIAIFGGGCFWCVEAVFSRLKGVISVSSGYAGEKLPAGADIPTYEEVCSGKTGHAEVVKVEFHSEIISYETLLSVFFASHDPTTPDRQGNDQGTQYRSIIFYTSELQKGLAEEYIKNLEKEKIYSSPIVTKVAPETNFYEAEDHHQRYFDSNRQTPYCQFVINPKIEKLRGKYKKFLKE
jgi:peptide-methionine (S)-S-oxide reductase